MTRPLRSTPITGASPLLRAGPPARPATVLTPTHRGLLPLAAGKTRTHSVGSGLLPFHAEAADRARVASMPDTAWPINGHPPDSSRDPKDTPVLMSSSPFDTSTAIRLRSPSRSPPDTSPVPFPHRSPRSRHHSRSMWRFGASPRRAAPKGRQSFISCTAPLPQALPTSSPLPCSGHTLRATTGVTPGNQAASPLPLG
jgi:hypothetical protein